MNLSDTSISEERVHCRVLNCSRVNTDIYACVGSASTRIYTLRPQTPPSEKHRTISDLRLPIIFDAVLRISGDKNSASLLHPAILAVDREYSSPFGDVVYFSLRVTASTEVAHKWRADCHASAKRIRRR